MRAGHVGVQRRALAACEGDRHVNRILRPLRVKRPIFLCGIFLEVPQLIIAARFVLIPAIERPAGCAGNSGLGQGAIVVHALRLRKLDIRMIAGSVFKRDGRKILCDGKREILLVVRFFRSVAAECAFRDRRSQRDSAANHSRIRNRQRAVFAQRNAIVRSFYAPFDGFVGGGLRFNRRKVAKIIRLFLHDLVFRNVQLNIGHSLEGGKLDRIHIRFVIVFWHG